MKDYLIDYDIVILILYLRCEMQYVFFLDWCLLQSLHIPLQVKYIGWIKSLLSRNKWQLGHLANSLINGTPVFTPTLFDMFIIMIEVLGTQLNQWLSRSK